MRQGFNFQFWLYWKVFTYHLFMLKTFSSSTFIHHGLDLNEYSFTDKKESYLLYLGAIHPRKNVELAIKVANWVDMPLTIVGPDAIQDIFARKFAKSSTTKSPIMVKRWEK